MVLINIDTLSDSELRCIAQQEDIEDWEVLSREDLIDSIKELYEDENRLELAHPSYTGHRYVRTLTATDHESSFELPGVEGLPAKYNETSIHFITKDANWAYAFWSLSPQDQSLVDESDDSLVIRSVVLAKGELPESSFDIDILGSDLEWSFELPWAGREYKALLVRKSIDNSESVLAESNIISVGESWLSKHPEVLKDKDTFDVLVTSLVTKGGKVINNRQVREILEKAREN